MLFLFLPGFYRRFRFSSIFPIYLNVYVSDNKPAGFSLALSYIRSFRYGCVSCESSNILQ